MKQAFCSWSGGKDSVLAYYLATRSGLNISCLLNVVEDDGEYSCTHGLPVTLLQAQAQLVGVPMVHLKTNGIKYEEDLRALLRSFKQKGFEVGVFGNGDIKPQWIGGVCREEGLDPRFPLHSIDKEKVLRNLVVLGFETIVVAARADLLGPEWLGRRVDEDFIKAWGEMKRKNGIGPADESGLYHTLVIDGPIFKRKLEIIESKSVLRHGYWFLDIQKVA